MASGAIERISDLNIVDLQVHCMLHKDEGIDYQWPPEFVKEGESAADSQTKTVVIGQLKRGSAASSSANRRWTLDKSDLIFLLR